MPVGGEQLSQGLPLNRVGIHDDDVFWGLGHAHGSTPAANLARQAAESLIIFRGTFFSILPIYLKIQQHSNKHLPGCASLFHAPPIIPVHWRGENLSSLRDHIGLASSRITPCGFSHYDNTIMAMETDRRGPVGAAPRARPSSAPTPVLSAAARAAMIQAHTQGGPHDG